MQVKFSQAVSMIAKILAAKLVPMLEGSPGCGKSHVGYAIAKRFNLKLIDLRLSQCDPTDLLGFPNIMGRKAGYVPMETFPIEGDELPVERNAKGEIIHVYAGWLIFFDEFNSASPAVQAASYKIILDRMIGIHKLHKNVAMMTAGNLETDGAIVNPMSTALQSRLVWMELVVDHIEWCEWGAESSIDHRITDFVRSFPGKLYTFSPNHTDKTYACPRTWEFASRLLPDDHKDKDTLPILAGTVSEGIAREFLGYCDIYRELPTPAQILATPDAIRIPDESSILYALTGTISHNATMDNITQYMKFVRRLPDEFQAVAVKDTLRRNKKPDEMFSPMMKVPAVAKYIQESAQEVL